MIYSHPCLTASLSLHSDDYSIPTCSRKRFMPKSLRAAKNEDILVMLAILPVPTPMVNKFSAG